MTVASMTLHCSYVSGLLPWYVNGTLDGEQCRQVDIHVGSCARCSAELDAENRMADGLRDRPQAAIQTPHAAWDNFAARLDAVTNHRSAVRSQPKPARRWLLPLAIGQAAAILVLAVALYLRSATPLPDAGYRTLASADAVLDNSGSLLRLAFDTAPAPAELRRLSRTLGAQLVSGPSANNVVTLALAGKTSAQSVAALAWLRQQPHILLAEPVAAPDPP